MLLWVGKSTCTCGGLSCFGLGPATLGLTWWSCKLNIAGRRWFFVIKILQQATLDSLTKNTFNALDQGLVLTANKSEGIASLCSAAGPADTVRVGIRCIRDVIVDDM